MALEGNILCVVIDFHHWIANHLLPIFLLGDKVDGSLLPDRHYTGGTLQCYLFIFHSCDQSKQVGHISDKFGFRPDMVSTNEQAEFSSKSKINPRVRQTRQYYMGLLSPNLSFLISVVVNSANKAPANKVNPAIRHDKLGPLKHF